MAAVNDVNVSSAYANREAVGEYWGLRRDLELIEADFIGHWRADCPVRALDRESRASLYRSPQGPVLVVATRSASPRTVEIEIDRFALGLADVSEARDVRRGVRLPFTTNRLSVPLEARSYTYVTFGP
jgi:hypothetical protein